MVLSRHRHNHFHYHRLCHVHVFTPLQPPWGLQANNYLMEILALGCQRVLFKENMSLKVWILSFCLHLDLVETVQEVQWKWKWKCGRCNETRSLSRGLELVLLRGESWWRNSEQSSSDFSNTHTCHRSCATEVKQRASCIMRPPFLNFPPFVSLCIIFLFCVSRIGFGIQPEG